MSQKEEDKNAYNRKKDHIELAFESAVSTQNIDQRFAYEPLLSAHPKADAITNNFLGHFFSAPLWISSMTGGTEHAKKINTNLARVSSAFDLGMGLGSCRSLLFDDSHISDFAVRKEIGERPFYANLGIAQIEDLIRSNKVSVISELLKKLEASGLIVHINPLQEWLQPEGDIFFESPITTITKLIDKLDTSIIVKEVGQGMGPQSLEALFRLPIDAIEFGAHGGTNFSMLELLRSEKNNEEAFESLTRIGHSATDMVLMSNQILNKLGTSALCKQVIISGGVKNFLDGYYLNSLMECNSIYGQASQMLKYALEGYEKLYEYVDNQIKGYKLAESYLQVNV